MLIAAYFLSFPCLILNGSLFVQLKPPWNFLTAVFQIVAVDFSPFLNVPGVLGAGLAQAKRLPAFAPT